jgi:hypothetical protein
MDNLGKVDTEDGWWIFEIGAVSEETKGMVWNFETHLVMPGDYITLPPP